MEGEKGGGKGEKEPFFSLCVLALNPSLRVSTVVAWMGETLTHSTGTKKEGRRMHARRPASEML